MGSEDVAWSVPPAPPQDSSISQERLFFPYHQGSSTRQGPPRPRQAGREETGRTPFPHAWHQAHMQTTSGPSPGLQRQLGFKAGVPVPWRGPSGAREAGCWAQT